MADVRTVTTVLARLRIKGAALSLDDFGTGYSSLVQLHHMPFTELKLDRAFVAPLVDDADARIIVRAMTGLAGHLGLGSVAEGIEDEAVAAILVETGCRTGQGYLYGRPMPAAAFLDWLDGRPPEP